MSAQSDATLRAIVTRTAGAIATGIGVLGFVALVGGADYWLRFSSAGLPADETVADLSRSQLLVVGTRDLFPFLAIALVEVVILYLLEQAVRGRLRLWPLKLLARYAERDHTPAKSSLVTGVRVVLSVLAIPVAVVAHTLLAQRNTLSSVALVAGVAAGLALIVALYAGGAHRSFPKFVLAALFASAAFALFSGASRTAEAPEVRPVALVVAGKPLAGIYVAASTGHLFVGEVCANGPRSEVGDASTGSLMDLPRKDVSLLLVGNNVRLEEAISREHSLLASLPRLTTITQSAVDAVAPPSPNTTQGVACTGPAAASLAH